MHWNVLYAVHGKKTEGGSVDPNINFTESIVTNQLEPLCTQFDYTSSQHPNESCILATHNPPHMVFRDRRGRG